MKTFLSIFKKFGKDIIYLSLILGVFLYGRYGGDENDGRPTTPAPIIVEDDGEIAREVIADAGRADKPRNIVERVSTRDIAPDTVYVSDPVAVRDSTDESPEVLPSVPLDLPEWGIQEVRLEGHRLEVSALSRGTGGVERGIYTLGGNYQPGVTIRSGNIATSVREDREFRFLRLGMALDTHGGVNAVTGEPVGMAILSGPIHLGGSHIRLSPSVGASTGDGLSVGVSARICLIGGCD